MVRLGGWVTWCVAAAVALAGCGGGGAQSATPAPAPTGTAAAAPTPVPAAIATCGDAGGGWRELALPSGQVAAALGHGPGVVFLNMSDDDPCPWMPLARATAAAGRTAAVMEYGDVAAGAEREATEGALAVARAAGRGRPVVLVGASLGGRIVFEAAARSPRRIAGIVSLSGERQVEDYRDILPDIRRVTTPVLYAGTRQDALTDGMRQPREIRAALPAATTARFLALPGSAHGIDLLFSARVTRALDGFVAAALRHRG